ALETGDPKTSHHGLASGLSPDPRVLNRIFVRCSSAPGYVASLIFRVVAAPGGTFPRIGNIWLGHYLYNTRPDLAQKVHLYLGADNVSAAEAIAIRSANPNALIFPNVDLADNGGEGSPLDEYYLRDVNGNKIEDWCGPPRYLLNVTKPEVGEFLAH